MFEFDLIWGFLTRVECRGEGGARELVQNDIGCMMRMGVLSLSVYGVNGDEARVGAMKVVIILLKRVEVGKR